MGTLPTPKPDGFPIGNECPTCTNDIPLFVPGATPAIVTLTRFGGPGDPTKWDLPQFAPCGWEIVIPGVFMAFWVLDKIIPPATDVGLFVWTGFWSRNFTYTAAPRCQINVPNNHNPIFAVGTWAKINW